MTIDYKFIAVAVMFIVFDILTGVVGACIRGEFKSNAMRKGGMHKLFLIVVIAFGVSLDIAQQLVDLGFSIPCCTAICSYIALMEILSVVENIHLTFPDALPKSLTNILYQTAKEKGIEDKKEDDE